MKKYFVRSSDDRVEYFEITGETQDSYLVLMTKISNDGYTQILEERISRDLLNMCLKTGYIYN